jgi:polysaccharide pyruvyl transferase WcaK-like protein
LKETKKDDIIVIGGGEVFFARWGILASFIFPWFHRLYKSRFFNKLERKINFTSYIFAGKELYSPYVPEINVSTFYISVGGQFNVSTSFESKNRLKYWLGNAKSLSVRDERTLDSLKKENIKSKLIPDSAILMSKLFPKQELLTLKSSELKTPDFNYIFLQIALNKGPKDIQYFIEELSKIASNLSLKIVCCPIGLASGHDDPLILKEMVSLSSDWLYIEPKNLYDIMFLISNSKLYVGTSLHGAITAFSYTIPIVPLNKKIKKLNSFVQTWTSEIYISTVDFESIHDGVQNSFKKWNESKASELVATYQNMIEDYFREINLLMKS